MEMQIALYVKAEAALRFTRIIGIGLAATADVIVSIYQNEEDRELGIIRLGMMKNRYGPRGNTQAMRIDYSTLSIEEADDVEFEDDGNETLSALVGLAT